MRFLLLAEFHDLKRISNKCFGPGGLSLLRLTKPPQYADLKHACGTGRLHVRISITKINKPVRMYIKPAGNLKGDSRVWLWSIARTQAADNFKIIIREKFLDSKLGKVVRLV